MESNKWLEEHNYYRLKPNASIYVKDIVLEKVYAKIYIDISYKGADIVDYHWLYSHGIYSIESKEKLTNEEIEEIAILIVAYVDKDFTNYLRSVRDEKR